VCLSESKTLLNFSRYQGRFIKTNDNYYILFYINFNFNYGVNCNLTFYLLKYYFISITFIKLFMNFNKLYLQISSLSDIAIKTGHPT